MAGRTTTKGRSRHHHPNKTSWNPPKGAPAILLTCETGRESKCRREGRDILEHYYFDGGDHHHNHQPEPSSLSVTDDPVQKETNKTHDSNGSKLVIAEVEKEKSPANNDRLSLDEELAQLRQHHQENSRKGRRRGPSGTAAGSPFTVFETGCRGTVLMVYTGVASPAQTGQSMNIQQSVLQVGSDTPPESAASDTKGSDQVNLAHDAGDVSSIKESDDRPVVKKRRLDRLSDNAAVAVQVDCNIVPLSSDTVVIPPVGQQRWDPREMVRRIMTDIVKSETPVESEQQSEGIDDAAAASTNKTAPSSRFISRMIPLQATCFASVEEISHHIRPLIDQYLISVRRLGQGIAPAETKETRIDDNLTSKAAQKSFMVQFKKRNCSHLKRDHVIDAIVGQMEQAVKLAEVLPWRVKLENPDLVLQVEICKTLAGLALYEQSYLQEVGHFSWVDVRQVVED